MNPFVPFVRRALPTMFALILCFSFTPWLERGHSFANGVNAYTREMTWTSQNCITASLWPMTQSFNAAGGTGTVQVVLASTCPWTAQAQDTWVTLNSGSNHSGTQTLTYTVAPNSSAYRTTMLTLAGRTFTIEQSGPNGSCAPTPITNGQTLNARFSSDDCRTQTRTPGSSESVPVKRYAFNATAGQRLFTALTDDSPNSLPLNSYLLSPGKTVLGANNGLSSFGRNTFTIPVDGTYFIEVEGRALGDIRNFSLTLNLVAAGCGVTLSPNAAAFETSGGSGALNIAAPSQCTWRASTGASWVALTSSLDGTGDGRLTFTVAPNATATSRRAWLYVNGQSHLIEQAGTNGVCLARTIAHGQSLNGALAENDCRSRFRNTDGTSYYLAERFSFNGVAGQFAAFRFSRLDFAAQLYLVNATGQIVGELTEPHLNEAAHFVLPTSGVYTVELTTRFARATGNYAGDFKLTNNLCSYQLSQSSFAFDAAAAAGSLNVTAAAGCTWSVQSNASWLSISEGATGTGNGMVKFNVAANNVTVLRRGALTLDAQTITVEQAGLGGNCTITPLTLGQPRTGSLSSADCRSRYVSSGSTPSTAPADLYAVTLQAGDQVIAYATSTSAVPSLTLFDPAGTVISRTENANPVRLPLQNYLTILRSGIYLLEVSGTGATNYSVTLVASATNCYVALGATEYYGESAGGAASVDITTATDCTWRAIADVGWITLTKATALGNGSVEFNLAANQTSASRRGTLFINGQAYVIHQAGTGSTCQPVELLPNITRAAHLDVADCQARFPRENNLLADRYRFQYNENQLISLVVTPSPGSPQTNLFFELLITDATGRVLAQSRTSPARLPAEAGTYLALPATGTYFLEAVSQGGVGVDYRITLNVASDCQIAFLPREAQLDAFVASGSIKVVTNPSCAWTAATFNAPWLNLTSATNGVGPGVINYVAARNPDEVARRGSVRVTMAGRTTDFAVEQAGQDGACPALPLSSNQAVTGTLTPADCKSRFFGFSNFRPTQADRYVFTAKAGDRVTIVERPASGFSSDFIYYSLIRADGLLLAQHTSTRRGSNDSPFFTLPVTGEYWLEIARSGDSGPSSADYTMAVVSQPSSCQPRLGSPQQFFEAAGGAGSFELNLPNGCDWRALTVADWVTLTNTSGTGSSSSSIVRFNVAANPATEARRATIYIGEQRFTVLQSGAGGTCTITPITPGRLISGMLNNGDCPLSSPRNEDVTQPDQRQIARRYSFNGKAGDLFSAHLTGDGQHLRLFSAAGALLTESGGRGDYVRLLQLPSGTPNFVLPADGVYYLDVVLYYRLNDGRFNLLVNLVSKSCSYAVSNATRLFDEAFGEGSLRVTAPSACPWQVVALADWVIPASTSGTGNATIIYNAVRNPNSRPRVTHLSVNGQVTEIQQAGVSGQCTARPLTFGRVTRGTLSEADCYSQFNLVSSPNSSGPFIADRYRFSATANQQIALRFHNDNWPYVTLSDANGKVLAHNQVVRDSQLAASDSLPDSGFFPLPSVGEYQIELASRGTFPYVFTAHIAPTSCNNYTVTAPERRFDATAQSGTLNVLCAGGCPWTAASDADWISFTNASGSGAGTVSFTLAPNPGEALRTGNIQLADQRVTIIQAGAQGRCAIQTLTSGQAFNGRFQVGDCRSNGETGSFSAHRYSFTGRAGERFNAVLNLAAVVYSGLALRDSQGELLLANPPDANPFNTRMPSKDILLPGGGTFTLPRTGIYTIEVLSDSIVAYTLNTQIQPACTLTANLTPTTLATFDASGGNGGVAITGGAGCDWTLNANVPWITTEASGVGNGTAAFMVLPNNGGPRIGQLHYPGGSLTITQQARAVAVSAASYSPNELAVGAIGALFGQGLAKINAAATTTPLPTLLAETSVRVRDSAGITREAPLFVVTTGQINFLVPVASTLGPATLQVVNGGVPVASGTLNLVGVAPGLFAANANGQGAPAGVVLRVRGGVQSLEPLIRLDTATNRYVNVPIELGPESDEVYLTLFGTGWRGRAANGAVSATLGGLEAPISYVGAQGDLAGLDQLNLRVPRALVGRGAINLIFMVDGKTANQMQVVVQ